MENRKFVHFQLSTFMGNKLTLIGRLDDGTINYKLYSGWNSSGTPNSLSNLQCVLPLHPEENESEELFTKRLADIITKDSITYIVKQVPVKVTFA